MKFLLRLASYLFHPLWMPMAGSIYYFLFIPRYFPPEIIKSKLIGIAIITIFIPVVFYFLLKNLGRAENIFLEKVEERRWPLFFFSLLNIMVLTQILKFYNYPGLFYYFCGILASSILAYLLSLLRIKASLHMMGLSGLLMFVIGFCIYFNLYLLHTIAFLIIATGLTASSRLYFKAHSTSELSLGFILGFLPQLAVFYLWITEYRMLDQF
ncbi:hypothetical protein [Christiangramia aquimixticola]|uniref:hypothetical protein n=1 Tax=Christiangramia aquimixticola TaxID=1697558 RepID=UPI003AA87A27